MKYLILSLLWVGYFAVHSLTASGRIKSMVSRRAGKYYKYYRAFYTVVSVLTLIPVMQFEKSMDSPWLIHSVWISWVGMGAFIIPGLILGGWALRGYARLFEGVRSLFFDSQPGSLQQSGIHRFVRHPLYSATLLLLWGYFLVRPQWHVLETASLLSLYILIGIRLEEQKLITQFGESYRKYRSRVPSLIPMLPVRHKKKG